MLSPLVKLVSCKANVDRGARGDSVQLVLTWWSVCRSSQSAATQLSVTASSWEFWPSFYRKSDSILDGFTCSWCAPPHTLSQATNVALCCRTILRAWGSKLKSHETCCRESSLGQLCSLSTAVSPGRRPLQRLPSAVCTLLPY